MLSHTNDSDDFTCPTCGREHRGCGQHVCVKRKRVDYTPLLLAATPFAAHPALSAAPPVDTASRAAVRTLFAQLAEQVVMVATAADAYDTARLLAALDLLQVCKHAVCDAIVK